MSADLMYRIFVIALIISWVETAGYVERIGFGYHSDFDKLLRSNLRLAAYSGFIYLALNAPGYKIRVTKV